MVSTLKLPVGIDSFEKIRRNNFYYRLYVNFGERVPIYKEALVGTDEEFYPPQANPGILFDYIILKYHCTISFIK